MSYPDGRKAFVLKSQAMPFEQWEAGIELTAESILRKAKSLMGLPYLWAGNSAKAVDCSGLTRPHLFPARGHHPARRIATGARRTTGRTDPRLQKTCNRPTCFSSASATKTGTFAAFATSGFTSGTVNFLHSAGCVKINSLLPDRPNYDRGNAEELVRVRRFLGQVGTPGIERIRDNPALSNAAGARQCGHAVTALTGARSVSEGQGNAECRMMSAEFLLVRRTAALTA